MNTLFWRKNIYLILYMKCEKCGNKILCREIIFGLDKSIFMCYNCSEWLYFYIINDNAILRVVSDDEDDIAECFWCEKKLLNEKDIIKCRCGRILCDNCETDGSCNSCPFDCASLMYYRITELSTVKGNDTSDGDIKSLFRFVNKKFIIKSLKFLIEELENGKWDRTNFNDQASLKDCL